jgi:hypothetical protein
MDDGESFTTNSKWVKKKAKLTALPQGQAQLAMASPLAYMVKQRAKITMDTIL